MYACADISSFSTNTRNSPRLDILCYVCYVCDNMRARVHERVGKCACEYVCAYR